MTSSTHGLRLITTFALLAFVLCLMTGVMPSAGTSSTNRIQAQAAGDSGEEHRAPSSATAETGQHLLIDAIDMLSFGDVRVNVVAPDSPIDAIITTTTNLSTTWEEARSTTLFVASKNPGLSAAMLLDSTSYKFTSPEISHVMLDLLPKDPSLLDPTLTRDLNNRSVAWRAWYELDKEGLPSYLFLFQNNSYIIQVIITTSFETGDYGRQMLNRAAKKLISKSLGQNPRWQIHIPLLAFSSDRYSASPRISSTNLIALPSNSPFDPSVNVNQQERVAIRGETWEHICQYILGICRKHHLVVWNYPSEEPNTTPEQNDKINDPHYYGNGGDNATCTLTEGCITKPWHFWETKTKTKLGVSSLFYLTRGEYLGDPDVLDATKYSAKVYSPGPFLVVEALNLSTTATQVNQNIRATFKVKNLSGEPIILQELAVGARRGNDWSGEVADFPHVQNRLILPNEEYQYNQPRSFSVAGSYFAEPVVKINGSWGGIAGANRVNFTVYGQGQSPTPTPIPTPPPSSQGVTLISAWPQGTMGGQGQEFHPEVVVQTSGFSLDCTKDYLENMDGNLYGAHPIQGCVALGNNQYRIAFGAPSMKAPTSPGEYHSKWQIWRYPNHIGPLIDLWFRVATPPSNNRPPNTPSLLSPGDWSEIRSATAPQLCWKSNGDPDGDPVQFYAEVFDSAKIDNSGWITGTCWRPSHLDGQYYGYQWRVKTKDSRDAESGWSTPLHFTLSPPPNETPQPTSTPQIIPTQPPTSGSWWDTAYAYRRMIPISTNSPLAAGTIVKVNGLDLETLVGQGKARADHNDLRIARRTSDTTWQEVARAYYTGWDLEFQLAADISASTDTSYYLYYGNPGAGAPPTFSLPQGWWADMYIDKWWSSYVGTWAFNQAMDFGGSEQVCYDPLNHRARTGSSFDDSDKFRGRLFIPTTGVWTFRVYTNDGYALYLDGQQIGRFDGYMTNRWATIGTANLKAGWYSMELRNMWVNCGAWQFAMEGPSFSNQIVPATYFQRVWGNVTDGVTPGFEETQAHPVTPTPTNTPLPTATPTAPPAPTFAGDGHAGDLTVVAGQIFVPNTVRAAVSASGTAATPANSNGFNIGDTVLFHQTQGTASVGRWELNQIATINSSTSWTLAHPLSYVYDSTSGRAQVVKVPQYHYVTVYAGGTLTAPAWDGSTGGILALMCNGVCSIAGTVNVNGNGFRGGAAYNISNTVQYQGEGTSGSGGFSQTANGNGGGGGHSEYSVQAWTGGAGGGHSTSGGNAIGRNGSPTSFGGNVAGSPDLLAAVFGGGGGGYTQQVGGSGGGLGFLFVNALTVSGSMTANGRDGTPQGGESSGSGGGAGGALLVRAGTMNANGAITALGGAGGPSGPQYGTPGGSGSAGRIRIEYCTSFTGTTPPSASVQQINCPGSPTPVPTATASTAPTTTPTQQPTPNPACLKPLLRYRNDGRHLHLETSDPNELGSGQGGWVYEGMLGSVAPSPDCYAPGAVELIRYREPSSGKYLLTADPAEMAQAEARGFVREGIVGYVLRAEDARYATRALFRLRTDSPYQDYLFSIDPSEVSSAQQMGYIYEGITAYVFFP